MIETVRKARVPIVIVMSIAFIVVQDTLNTIFHVQGPVTVLIAGLLALIALASLAGKHSAFSSRAVPVPMMLFIVWAVVRFAMHPSVIGLQNLLVWTIFPLTIGVVFSRSEPGTFERAYPWWKVATVVASFIYLIEVVREGLGANVFPYASRGSGWLSLMALVLVAPAATLLRQSKWPLILLISAIVLSESRTPMAIALVMGVFTFALRPFKKRLPSTRRIVTRVLAASLAGGAVAYLAITQVPFVRDRFAVGDGFSVGGVEVNTSGRFVLWPITIAQWQQSPWIGNGPGSAQTLITNRFPGFISHPHNEYLRFLDDTGMVGMALWGLGMLILLQRAAKSIRKSTDLIDRTLHTSALLALVVMLLGAITDNITISVYCIMISGTVIGLSARRRQDRLDGTSIRPYMTPDKLRARSEFVHFDPLTGKVARQVTYK